MVPSISIFSEYTESLRNRPRLLKVIFNVRRNEKNSLWQSMNPRMGITIRYQRLQDSKDFRTTINHEQ